MKRELIVGDRVEMVGFDRMSYPEDKIGNSGTVTSTSGGLIDVRIDGVQCNCGSEHDCDCDVFPYYKGDEAWELIEEPKTYTHEEEDMFRIERDPINEWVKEVTKRAELELAYFILTRNDYELANYDVRQVTEHEEYRTALWFGFNFETTKREIPRTIIEVCDIRSMAVEVLRRNEK